MTMGPAPTMRMLSRSVRLGINVDQIDKPFKQIMAVPGTGARFGMVLHRKNRLADNPKSFIAVVEERDVSDFEPRWKRVGVHDKAMVLAGDFDLAALQVFNRVVGAAVASRHLACLPAERQCQQLVAETDAENRLSRGDQLAQYWHRIGRSRRRVARTVRQEDPVRPMA